MLDGFHVHRRLEKAVVRVSKQPLEEKDENQKTLGYRWLGMT